MKRQAPRYRGAGKLEGRVALITGGDTRIGRAVAVLYAREGADVAIVHRPEERADATATARAVAAEGRRCELIAGDVGDDAFCERAVVHALRLLGHIDVLVNHATGVEDARLPERDLRTGILGYFHMARCVLPHLPKGGAIVNSGAVAGLDGGPRQLACAAVKGAIQSFTRALARTLVPRGIRVNCVAPGSKRPAPPEHIAPSFVFFASNADSRHITGEVLTLLGGETTAA